MTDIHLGSGLLSRCGEIFCAEGLERVLLISDANVAALYAALVQRALRRAGISSDLFVFPPGEKSKTLAEAGRAYEKLIGMKADRRTGVASLGGGVSGDLAGFVAATFMRGVPLVHLPTSLVAQADASIGGKCGVDLPSAKNMVGSFYFPRLVLIDPEALLSLPEEEMRSGMAEVIKTALIGSAGLFSFLEKHREEIRGRIPDILEKMLAASVRIKAGVVNRDPFEAGERAVLNLGHTIGHALESACGYGKISHGEAVSLGIAGAIKISSAMKILEDSLEKKVIDLLSRFSLPAKAELPSTEKIMQSLCLDKKRRAGKLFFVLSVKLGKTVIRDDVPLSVVKEALESLRKRR
ncbi:MAG: 3-dehydroquinate synthase [bacterium]